MQIELKDKLIIISWVTRCSSWCRHPDVWSGYSGRRDRAAYSEILWELAAASVHRDFFFCGTGSGTHKNTPINTHTRADRCFLIYCTGSLNKEPCFSSMKELKNLYETFSSSLLVSRINSLFNSYMLHFILYFLISFLFPFFPILPDQPSTDCCFILLILLTLLTSLLLLRLVMEYFSIVILIPFRI